MDGLWHIVVGFLTGFIGLLPPGLLNLTAAKVSLRSGRSQALVFALGVCCIIYFQAYVGVFFSKLLLEHEDLLHTMEQFAVFIFMALSIFFLVRAITDKSAMKIEQSDRSLGQLFGQGLVLSVLNIFPIPFYLAFSSFLAGRDLFEFGYPYAYIFIIGAVLGSFLMLWVYIKYVRRFSFDSSTFAKKINYLLAVLTFLIAIGTAVRWYL